MLVLQVQCTASAAVAAFAYTCIFTSSTCDPEEIVEFDGNLMELKDSNPHEFSTFITLL